MNIEQQRVLLAWARLQLEIAVARNPAVAMDVKPETVTRSAGFRKLRAWFVGLSPRAKDGALRWMRSHIDGVREVMRLAAKTGEPLSMQDITIETFDHETKAPIGAAPAPGERQPASCPGSGAGLPGVELDGNGRHYVQCPRCYRRWPAHDINFTIPPHEPEA